MRRAGVVCPGSKPNAGFGKALGGGDIDGDGCGDLVVGAPFATVSGRAGAGSVTLISGGRDWRDEMDAQLVAAPKALGRNPVPGDFFGSSLAIVDWNGDGRDDVAIGVPGSTVAGRADAGALVVVEGVATWAAPRSADGADPGGPAGRPARDGRPVRVDAPGRVVLISSGAEASIRSPVDQAGAPTRQAARRHIPS